MKLTAVIGAMATARAAATAPAATSAQGLTLVHFSDQPEPFLTQTTTPYIPPNTS